MIISKHHCFRCGYDWPMLVEHPKKCPNCQSRKWDAKAAIEAMTDRDLSAMVEYGISHNFPCVTPPAWDNEKVEDLREEILTSIADGWEWSDLIKRFKSL